MRLFSLLTTAAAYIAGAALAVRHHRRSQGIESSPDAIKTDLAEMHRSLADEVSSKAKDVVPMEKLHTLKNEVLMWIDDLDEDAREVIATLKEHENEAVKRFANRLEKLSDLRVHLKGLFEKASDTPDVK